MLVGLLVLLGHTSVVLAQGIEFAYSHEEFPLSVKEKLSVYGNPLSIAIGESFSLAWSGFGPDVRNKIINQTKGLIAEGHKLQPNLEDYFAAIAFAVNEENLSDPELVDYLNMTNKVIENYSLGDERAYFARMKSFFENRALFHSDYLEYGLKNDNYRFVFVELEEVAEEGAMDDEYTEDEWTEEEWADESVEPEEWEEEWTEENWEDEEVVEEEEAALSSFLEEEVVTRPLSGPTILFDQLELIMDVGYDSISITNTKGSLLIMDNVFVGEHGRINWTSVGLEKEEAEAQFEGYELDVTSNEFHIRGASLKFRDVFEEPVKGEVWFKPEKTNNLNAMHYPRFASLDSNIKVKGLLGKYSYYKGGFTLEGRKITSEAKYSGKSTFNIESEGRPRFKVTSHELDFKDSVITSESARLIIYSKFDSIYHPGVKIRFDARTNNLLVQKEAGGFRNTPFVSTANNINFTADILSWNINQDSIYFSTLLARHEVPLFFQSNEYYDQNTFRELQGLYDFNPLKLVLHYAKQRGEDEFYLGVLAEDRNININILRGAVLNLYQKGYVEYDKTTGVIKVTEKGRHKGDAQKGDADFDSILLLSLVKNGTNAIFDINTQEIHINGVEKFYLSKELDVAVEADSSRISILKNRDIMFNGRLAAGNFDYVGKDFVFRYDSFLVEMEQIDAIELYVVEETRNGPRRKKINNSLSGMPKEGLKLWDEEEPESDSTAFDQTLPDEPETEGAITSAISGTSGVLFINKPDNKSGKKLIPNYPKFQGGGTGSVVYFDKPEILSGMYDKSLYFTLPPFDLDSLSDSDPAAIKFSGTFFSDSWFPEFTEKLHIMPDYSLGFDHAIPPEGYQLFGGNGRLFNRLTLDKNGVVGHGSLDFLTSTMTSDGFVFYPDSVSANGVAFNMEKEEFGGILYPRIIADNFHMRWLPLKDSMYISNKGGAFNMYEGNATLDGSVIVTNKGVNGLGLLSTYNSQTRSRNYTFNADDYNARHAEFNIESDIPEKPALFGDDVNVAFNLKSKQVDISPEIEGAAAIEFPYAQFKTSISNARWDMENQMVYMSKPENVNIRNSYFYTTRADLDSLRFNATNAEYDMQSLELKVSGIPFIKVADAMITPENGEVLILENSRIGKLYNTTIKLDTLTGYHELYDATVTIISRNEFEGEGIYRFINALKDTFAIKLRDFHLETFTVGRRNQVESQHSVAVGTVGEEEQFLISPGMYYKGDVKLLAHKKALQLDGFVKLDLKSIEDYDTWIKYASEADQEIIEFKFEESVTASGKLLSAGLHFDYTNNSLYSTFIFDKRDDQDEDFFRPSGYLSFKQDSNEYIIINKNKDLGISYSGKVFAYDPTTKGIRFEGPVRFVDNSKTMGIVASAIGESDFGTNDLHFKSFLTMDFKIPSSIYSLMSDDLVKVIDEIGAPEALGDKTELLYLMAEVIGDRATKSYEQRSALDYVPLSTTSPNLVRPFVFSNLSFRWSDDHKAFYNDGSLGLSNVLRTDINAQFEGFFEIKKTEGGETINLFIKAAPESWYYFSYEDNKLFIFTSNKELNTFVTEKTNIGKAKIGDFQFGPSDLNETLDFIHGFRSAYLGIDTPYDLQGEVVMEAMQGTEEDEEDDGF